MQRRLCAAILSLEAIALGLSTPVLISVAGVSTATALWIGLGLTVSCILVAGLLRFEWAYGLGWAIQVAAIALGFVIHAMFVLGAIFMALWATAYFLGSRIERERAEWAVTGEYPGRAPADPADHSHALVSAPCLSAPSSCSSPMPSGADWWATSCPGSRPRA